MIPSLILLSSILTVLLISSYSKYLTAFKRLQDEGKRTDLAQTRIEELVREKIARDRQLHATLEKITGHEIETKTYEIHVKALNEKIKQLEKITPSKKEKSVAASISQARRLAHQTSKKTTTKKK